MKTLNFLRVVLGVGALALATATAQAALVPVTFTNIGIVGGTTVFRGDLTGLGLTEIASLRINDSNSGTGGSPGIFSGFDLDAVFLDLDGNLATAGDRVFGSGFLFSAGTTRPTATAILLPTPAHPGPTFGSINGTTIDFATATLNALDGVSIADVNLADGFLTLGDGGSLGVNFMPTVAVGASLFLMVGEVGTGQGEAISADVFVSDTTIPEPGTLALLGFGLIGFAVIRRRKH